MQAQARNRELTHAAICQLTLLILGAAVATNPGWADESQGGTESSSETEQPKQPDPDAHMSEALRSSIGKIVVIAGPSPTGQSVTGSYQKATPGLVGGINSGSRLGNPTTQIGGVTVSFPIPILTLPGAIVGGISGKTRREIQDFRDALTEDLAQAENKPLTNDGLALDVYRSLQSVPGLDSKLFATTTPISDDTDAVLYASINDVTIDVQKKEAILTASATVTLRSLGDEEDLYEKVIRYQDRDTLANWTRDENALWHDYANFARHYLGREISAVVFDRVGLRHELRPKESETVALNKRNEWQAVSRSATPTLAWDLSLLGGDAYGSWVEAIDESGIYYDVEIYDMHRLVYAQKQIQEPVHKLAFDIDACKTYRWSVRPSYHVGGTIKFGEWMRRNPETDAVTANGIIGKKASDAPAYIQDFATLKIECGRR